MFAYQTFTGSCCGCGFIKQTERSWVDWHSQFTPSEAEYQRMRFEAEQELQRQHDESCSCEGCVSVY